MAWSIHLIIGARPNLMKAAPLLHALRLDSDFIPILVDTGKHYDHEMSGIFRDEFGMGEPDISLSVGSGTHGAQTAKILERYEAEILSERPDAVIVIGDVNSTVACSLAAAKLHIPVVHLEAGLRSNDRNMPEELNRIVTDQLAELLWTPSIDGDEHLLASGIPSGRICRVGNIMIDSLVKMLPEIQSRKAATNLGLSINKYAVITIHRPSNVDEMSSLSQIIHRLVEVSNTIELVWPMHPRTASKMSEQLPQSHNISIVEPLGYLDFLQLTSNAKVILTDSGGIQEEAAVLEVPCLTLRNNTERPCTLLSGMNQLVGTDPEVILQKFEEIFELEETSHSLPETWDGCTGERIASILAGFDGCIPTRSSNSTTLSTQ